MAGVGNERVKTLALLVFILPVSWRICTAQHQKKEFHTISVRESDSCSVVSDSLRPTDYTVHGILQARTLQWVAVPFRESSHF